MASSSASKLSSKEAFRTPPVVPPPSLPPWREPDGAPERPAPPPELELELGPEPELEPEPEPRLPVPPEPVPPGRCGRSRRGLDRSPVGAGADERQRDLALRVDVVDDHLHRLAELDDVLDALDALAPPRREMWSRPSRPGRMLTKAPNLVMFTTLPV